MGYCARFDYPDLERARLDLALYRLGQLVRHIGRLVDPATLVHRDRVDHVQRFPETQRAISDRQPGGLGRATLSQARE